MVLETCNLRPRSKQRRAASRLTMPGTFRKMFGSKEMLELAAGVAVPVKSLDNLAGASIVQGHVE